MAQVGLAGEGLRNVSQTEAEEIIGHEVEQWMQNRKEDFDTFLKLDMPAVKAYQHLRSISG